jgi:hypothetical protein
MPRELWRRILLLAGICAALGLALYTPRSLVRVRPFDFAKEYADLFKDKGPKVGGAMELGQALIQEMEKEKTLDEYIASETENRRIDVSGDAWQRFYNEIAAAANGKPSNRAWSARANKGDVFFGPDEEPVSGISDRLQIISQLSTVAYIVLPTPEGRKFLELRFGSGFEPKKIGGPKAMVFPLRRFSLVFLLLGIAAFVLLPRPKRSAEVVSYERIGNVIAQDILGIIFCTFFFWVPVHSADPFQQVYGENLGGTMFFGLLFGLSFLFLWTAARRAAFQVVVEDQGLRLKTLGKNKLYPYENMREAGYLSRKNMRSGLEVKNKDGTILRLDWSGLLHFERILEALSQARLWPSDPAQ